MTGNIHVAQGGWNICAIIALIAGILPSLPGFLHTVKLAKHVPQAAVTLYEFSWFVGFGVALSLYWMLAGRQQTSARNTKVQQAPIS